MRPRTRTLTRTIRVRGRERGGTALTFALLLIPIMLLVGGAIDFARMLEFKSMLQASVDEAALAGAAAFTDKTLGSTAVRVATEYFDNAFLPPSLSLSAPTVTANANGSINPALGSAPAYTVTVTATASVATTLMSLVIPSATITATATAGDPVITPELAITHINWWACDGNTAYLYQVPTAANGVGYDFSKVPAFSVANGTTQGNYYEIGTDYPATNPLGKLPTGQKLPSFSVNQPLGVMLRNDTNGNTVGCGSLVTGANSYGAPGGASQAFYSSLLLNGQSPSQFSNYAYTVQVTSDASGITDVWATLPASLLNPTGATVHESPSIPATYNTLATYLGVNDPTSGHSNCTSSTSKSGSVSTTTYRCRTQYFTTSTSTESNCLLYVQTGVTASDISALTSTTSAPAAARGNCFAPKSTSSQYAAPTCAQLSALATNTGSSSIAPAAVFWWDDGGGVGPGEQDFDPQGHCSATSPGGPGYGEDCLYKNNFFATLCTTNGGSGSGYTEVVLTQ
ncbi:TadE/TadG family type IV pilus assembly protein [Trinickia acidisoli]|uniref:TadE/TadG family type IV pilus assembly protein n=1 Tax=Trinickia acidisoli TaxID=2767482 RepID=UPI001A8DEAF5|nr:TadE/TadG family type IV pilus assembly protein [Trinickia acidisoli]